MEVSQKKISAVGLACSFSPGQSCTDGGYKNMLTDSKVHCNLWAVYKCWKTFGLFGIVTAIFDSAKLERERHEKLFEVNNIFKTIK